MKLTLEEFKANVIQWSTDRLIIKHGHVAGQLKKVKEEVDETIKAIEDGILDEIKDGIGDTAVTLINIDAVQKSNTTLHPYNRSDFDGAIEDKAAIYFLNNVKNEAEFTQHDYLEAWFNLQCACARLELDFMECCTLAWNEIKDRKGYFCKESMSFIKEEV